MAAGGSSAFCGQAQAFVNEVEVAMDAGSEQRLEQTLPSLASRLGSITPPPAIATDWHQAVSAIQQLAQDFQGLDLSDPQQLQQLEQKAQPIVGQLSVAGQHIDSYLRTQCGISVDTASSATG